MQKILLIFVLKNDTPLPQHLNESQETFGDVVLREYAKFQ